MRKNLLLLLALCLFPLTAFAYIPYIEGYVTFPDNTTMRDIDVTVCVTGYICRSTGTDYRGYYRIDTLHANDDSKVSVYFYTISPPAPKTGLWGSRSDAFVVTNACRTRDWTGTCSNPGMIVHGTLYPSPHYPTAIYPSNGATDIPTTGLVLRWHDGLDDDRRIYPVRYDLYAAGYDIEPTLYASDVPCNGSNGQCQFTVPQALQPATYYRWYAKAKLNAYGHVLTRKAPDARFSSAPAPSSSYAFRTYYGYFLSAENGGGGAVSARPWTVGAAEKFRIVDTNGGALADGDAVHLQAQNGMWVVALWGGGGPVDANSTTAGAAETFTIRKRNGTGNILASDPVALQCSNGMYVTAEGGGGREVNCNRLNAAEWETFTIYPQN